MTFQDDYNRAVRATEEEELAKVRGTWTSAAKWTQSKTSALSVIKDDVNKEFTAIQDFLSGKTDEVKDLFYFRYPESFEKHIAALDDETEIHGDLSDADLAWIENTRMLINKYHGIAFKGERPVPAARKTASKVCTIANRIPRSVPRKDAFTTAWAIVKSGGLEISVVGVSFGSRQEALSRLATYDPKDIIAVLVPEPDNRYDSEAISVKVMVNGGKGIYTLGYVPKTDIRLVKAFLGTAPELHLVGGETKGARLRLAA